MRKPEAEVEILPLTAALKPTPWISRSLVKPLLTPDHHVVNERARKAVQRFHAARLRLAAERDLAGHRGLDASGRVHSSLPFGPSTATLPSAPMFTLTLSGISIALFPIRDMTSGRLPDVSQQLASHVLFLRFAAGQDSARSGENRNAHAAEHARNFLRADVPAQAGRLTRFRPVMALCGSRTCS